MLRSQEDHGETGGDRDNAFPLWAQIWSRDSTLSALSLHVRHYYIDMMAPIMAKAQRK